MGYLWQNMGDKEDHDKLREEEKNVTRRRRKKKIISGWSSPGWYEYEYSCSEQHKVCCS